MFQFSLFFLVSCYFLPLRFVMFSHVICALKSYWTVWCIVVHTKPLRPALSTSGLIREVTTCHWNICIYLQARPVLYGSSIVQWKSSVILGSSISYSIPGQFCLTWKGSIVYCCLTWLCWGMVACWCPCSIHGSNSSPSVLWLLLSLESDSPSAGPFYLVHLSA